MHADSSNALPSPNLHQFVLDHSDPNASGSENYIHDVLLSMPDDAANAMNGERYTALQLAVKKKNLLMVKMLLSCLPNIDVNRKWNMTGISTLHMAVVSRHVSIVEELLNKGADVNIRDTTVSTPLFLAAKASDLGVLKLLLSRGADLSATDYLSQTCLHVAARCGNLGALKLLVSHGGDLSATGDHGNSLLHDAATSSRLEVIKYLVGEGADVNAKDVRGCTPLYVATRYGYLDSAQFLASEGADVNAKDKEGCTPLSHAARRGYLDIVKFFLDRVVEVDWNHLLLDAAVSDNLKFLQFLIENGADVNTKDEETRTTPLHQAVQQQCNSSAVEFLVNKGADLGARDKDGKTPLHDCALNRYYNNVDKWAFLIHRGADVNAVDRDGRTPLHHAFRSRNPDYAELLISRGADVHVRDNEGKTPLYEANIIRCSLESLIKSVSKHRRTFYEPFFQRFKRCIEMLIERGDARDIDLAEDRQDV